MEFFEKWATETQLAFTTSERDFLSASITRREQQTVLESARVPERSRGRKNAPEILLRGLVGVFAIAAVIALDSPWLPLIGIKRRSPNGIMPKQHGRPVSRMLKLLRRMPIMPAVLRCPPPLEAPCSNDPDTGDVYAGSRRQYIYC